MGKHDNRITLTNAERNYVIALLKHQRLLGNSSNIPISYWINDLIWRLEEKVIYTEDGKPQQYSEEDIKLLNTMK